jgi:hypothetical protein
MTVSVIVSVSVNICECECLSVSVSASIRVAAKVSARMKSWSELYSYKTHMVRVGQNSTVTRHMVKVGQNSKITRHIWLGLARTVKLQDTYG